ncbi:hypothetical protein [Sporisorium scitamineum]|uniref:Uncharacterized protein n=1 Tax=Sporisorium scitamineum TaxID=49012 RepID=A0A0F7S594_9BASI|nr:hypothetical protein [Sporisorium scitamineum]
MAKVGLYVWHYLGDKLEETHDPLPVNKTSRVPSEQEIYGAQNVLAPLISDPNCLMDGVDLNAKDFKAHLVPQGFVGSKLHSQCAADEGQVVKWASWVILVWNHMLQE